jgi:hypothetical protein
MREPARHSWHCPSCARQIPLHVDRCRCGAERRRLAALGYSVEAAPPPPEAVQPPPRRPPPATTDGPMGTWLGHRPDAGLATGWRVGWRLTAAVVVAATLGAMVSGTHVEPRPTRRNVRVLTTLDDYTRAARAGVANTIPAFLAGAGTLAILRPTMADGDLVEPVDMDELDRGLCSPSVAAQVRHEYPGYYDGWDDERLARTILEKYPEFSERLCVLPTWLGAGPGEIVKYELRPRSLLGHAGLWLRTLLVTALAAFGLANAYYRLLVPRLAAA